MKKLCDLVINGKTFVSHEIMQHTTECLIDMLTSLLNKETYDELDIPVRRMLIDEIELRKSAKGRSPNKCYK